MVLVLVVVVLLAMQSESQSLHLCWQRLVLDLWFVLRLALVLLY